MPNSPILPLIGAVTDANGDYAISNIEEVRGANNQRVPYNITAIFTGTNDADTAIEFSTPETAVKNIKSCFQNGIPVGCGFKTDQLFDFSNASRCGFPVDPDDF